MDSHGIASVAAAGGFLDDLLSRADSVKQSASIEPPLEESAFDDLRRTLSDTLGYDAAAEEPADLKKAQRFAVIETAVRDTFKSLIVSSPRGPRPAPVQPSSRLTDPSLPGHHTNRVPRVRQGLEPARRALLPLRQRAVRPRPVVLAG